MPLFDYVCDKCGERSPDHLFKNVDEARAALVRCPNCGSKCSYIPCQGSFFPFRPYLMDNIPGDPVMVNSFREEIVLKKMHQFEHKSKQDCRVSEGLVGWPRRRRVATVRDGRIVHQGGSNA